MSTSREGAIIFHIDFVIGRITLVRLKVQSIAQSTEANHEHQHSTPLSLIPPPREEVNPRVPPKHRNIERKGGSLRQLKALLRRSGASEIPLRLKLLPTHKARARSRVFWQTVEGCKFYNHEFL